jgi:putative hemolysin
VKFSIAAAAIVVAATVVGIGAGHAPASALTLSNPSPDFNPKLAAAYCIAQGGTVETRTAWYGTNGPNPLQLAGERSWCQFKLKSDGSRIHLLLDTLFTKLPTLAALAYYAELPPGNCQGNPASCYCSLLGGSDQFGGTNGAGGGWVDPNSIDQTLEACIFPDLSSIDSWGLTYHSQGIIRGIDLGKVLRFKNPFNKKR